MYTKSATSKIYGMLLLASISVFSAKAQQTRTTGDFTGIKAGDSFNINITQSDANTVKVDAPENVLSQIKTEVKDGILVISSEGNLKTDKDITISIGIKTLNSLDVSGAADVRSENQLKTDKLSIESSGAGDVHLDLIAGEIKGSVSGAGDVTMKGTAQLLDISVSGAGELKASELEAEKVKAKVSGAGNAKVYAKQSLDAEVSGAGDVIYKGNPVDRNVNISGAGSVRESKSGNGEETASDTTKIKLGGRKYMIIGDDKEEKEEVRSSKDSIHDYNSDFKHWNGIELGANGLMDFKNSLNINSTASYMELDYAKSYQFGLNLFEKDFHIYKNYINLVTGLGFNFNHYAFANNVTLHTDTTYIWASNDSVKYRRNKLNISYLRAPLLLEFNTSKNPNKNFHIAVGAEFEYRIHAVTKQRFDLNDKHYRIKQRDDFNLEPFNTSLVARIGYNKVTVYASYGLNRLFKKDEGPQVYPVGLGICWTL
jgi:hypothetical protein